MIKHKRLCSSRYGDAEGEYYLCNEAVKPKPEKLVDNWNKVNCKNCLKHKR
jgi:hypothetical protein